MKCVAALQEKEEDEGSPVGKTFLQIPLVTHHLCSNTISSSLADYQGG